MAADASLIFAAASVAARRHRVGDAVREVVVEQLEGHRLQGLRRRRDLFEHVDAVPVVVDHPLEAAHLALDPPEASLHGELVLAVAGVHGGLLLPMLGRARARSRTGGYAPGVIEKGRCAVDPRPSIHRCRTVYDLSPPSSSASG